MTTVFRPDVQYARSGDVSIAYQVVGDGPSELVLVSFLGNLVWGWAVAEAFATYTRSSLTAKSRVRHPSLKAP